MDSRTRKRLRDRKYGVMAHRRVRYELREVVASGTARCARCGELIEPGSKWDVGHDDYHPQYISGPEHASCNRGAPHRNNTSRVW